MSTPSRRLPPGWRRLPRSFYARDSLELAPQLLGKLLVRWEAGRPMRAARLVEVEAYRGGEDPASHAYRGRTDRNASMFGRPGLLYVYFTYGMHWCANVVCGSVGEASAVLLRAGAPLRGVEAMRPLRPAARRDSDLCSGPARLCGAFGVDRALDGADLVLADRGVTLADDGTLPPETPVVTTRVGVSNGAEHRWRWYVGGDPNVSRR